MFMKPTFRALKCGCELIASRADQRLAHEISTRSTYGMSLLLKLAATKRKLIYIESLFFEWLWKMLTLKFDRMAETWRRPSPRGFDDLMLKLNNLESSTTVTSNRNSSLISPTELNTSGLLGGLRQYSRLDRIKMKMNVKEIDQNDAQRGRASIEALQSVNDFIPDNTHRLDANYFGVLFGEYINSTFIKKDKQRADKWECHEQSDLVSLLAFNSSWSKKVPLFNTVHISCPKRSAS